MSERRREEIIREKWVELCVRGDKLQIDVGACVRDCVLPTWGAREEAKTSGQFLRFPRASARRFVNSVSIGVAWADYEWLNTVVERTILRAAGGERRPSKRPDVTTALVSDESLVSRYEQVPQDA